MITSKKFNQSLCPLEGTIEVNFLKQFISTKSGNKIISLLILLILIFNLNTSAKSLEQVDSLSSSSYISLLTCDPGNELYSVFGHSAIGVVDPENRIALVFNYGTFSFQVPFFYVKFASGKLMYQLSIVNYQRFLNEYKYEQRMVTEDILNLTQDQKQRLFQLLKENYKPENREYQYDFFFDNCATRILDIIELALGDDLIYNSPKNPQVKTHRNLIDEYLQNSYWSDFGIDIVLGSVIDRPATQKEKTFLPDYLNEYVNKCTVNEKPLVRNSRKLVTNSVDYPATLRLIRPKTIFWFLFVILIALTIIYRAKPWIIGDKIVFGAFGILGLIVFLMWFATDHDAAKGNLNILWANPLYLIYVWLIGSNHKQLFIGFTFAIVLLNLGVLVGWNTLPQMYHETFIPMIGILLVRSGIIALRFKRF